MRSWVKREKHEMGPPAELKAASIVLVLLEDAPHPYMGRADSWAWDGADGYGRIEHYLVVDPPGETTGVGDVNGTAPGSAARFNAGKPDLSLIPAGLIGELEAWRQEHGETKRVASICWADALAALGSFQMRQSGRFSLLHCLHLIDDDGNLWVECARVFDYGRAKYSAWNWARGQAWSIPIASAMRHIVLGALRGENLDPESGLTHRGHIACNIVMLLWFYDEYHQGDDRFVRPGSFGAAK